MMRCAGVLAALLCAAAAVAHPLGNNTVNRQAELRLAADRIELVYRHHLAELPSLAAQEDADRDADGNTTSAELQVYADAWARRVLAAQVLSVGDAPRQWILLGATYSVEPGEAGLATLRLSLVAQVQGDMRAGGELSYRDEFEPERDGWKEIWINPSGDVEVISGSAAQRDRSAGLTQFDSVARLDDHVVRIEYRLAAEARSDAQAPASAAIRRATKNSVAIHAQTREPQIPRSVNQTRAPAAHVPSTQAAPPAVPTPGMWHMFRLGVHHIAAGWDHLCFLLGLLLMRRQMRTAVRIVTAFTLAHSLTLAAAAVGLVHAPAGLIEPAIALSIAYVGAVAAIGRGAQHGAWLAFGFGLVHGFGFAAALAESLGAGSRLQLSSLLAFNLGIELSQVALVLLALPLLAALSAGRMGPLFTRTLACAVTAAGGYWFVGRSADLLIG